MPFSGAKALFLVLSTLLLTVGGMGHQYNEQTGKIMAMASAGAYTDNPSSCLPVATYKVVKTFKAILRGNAIFGYFAYESRLKGLILTFRGSESATQLLDELLHAHKVPYPGRPGVAVAAYFIDAFLAVNSSMRIAYNQAISLYPQAPFYITGHSLGGALATLAALELPLRAGVPTFLFTLGAPRLGNGSLSNIVLKKHPNAVRIVHGNDIVAHLPPCFSDGKYSCTHDAGNVFWAYHHGTEVWYKKDMPAADSSATGTWTHCAGDRFGEDRSCSNTLSPFFFISDHLNYFGLRVGQHCLKQQLVQEFMDAQDMTNSNAQERLDASNAFAETLEQSFAVNEVLQQREIDLKLEEWKAEMRAQYDEATLHREQPDLF